MRRPPVPRPPSINSPPAAAPRRGNQLRLPPLPRLGKVGSHQAAPRQSKRSHTDLDDPYFSCDASDLDAPPLPWSEEDRRRALSPVTKFLEALSEEEKQCWSLITILVPTLWFERGAVTAAHIRNAKRQLLRAIKKAGLTLGAFVIDVVVRPRFGQTDGPVGLLLHFHGVGRIAFSDRRAKKAFRAAMRPWAQGKKAIEIRQPREAKGGLASFLLYGLKDLQNPLKPLYGETVPTNDGWTTEMRRLVAESGIEPRDLLVLRGLKRHRDTLRVLDPKMQGPPIAGLGSGPGLPSGVNLCRHRILPNGCLAPVPAIPRRRRELSPLVVGIAEPRWAPILPPLSRGAYGLYRPSPRPPTT